MFQPWLTRWVDRLLPYQFEIFHIPGKDMRIVDFLMRYPYNDPWPESESDEIFLVATINSFQKALNCMKSRLENNCPLNRIGNFLEVCRRNGLNDSSLRGCFCNQHG